MTLNRRKRRLATVLAGVAAGMTVAVGVALLSTGPADAHTQNVRLLQRDLVGLAYLPTGGVDGIYGPDTTAAVRDFQADAGIKVDGNAGDVTMAKLTGKVKAVQRKTHARANGDYGSGTTAAVRRWQSAHHVTPVDGITGPITMKAMGVTRHTGRKHGGTGGSGNPAPPPASGSTRAKIVSVARSQLGTGEHPPGSNCTKYGPCESWCALFASWVWRKAGVNINTAFTGYFYDWGVHRGTAHRTDHGMRPGDVVLYGTGPQNTSTSVHIGIVVKTYSDGRILTIEGNTSNGVHERGPFDPRHARAAGRPGNIYAYVSPVR
ncbi:MAG: peptidoglycan-binding protein [Mycobacteriales bacterium]